MEIRPAAGGEEARLWAADLAEVSPLWGALGENYLFFLSPWKVLEQIYA